MDITEKMIEDCINDTSVDGKYNKLYQMIVDSIDNNISDNKIKSIMDTLLYSGIDTTNMSKPELLFEYSKLY